MADVKTKIKIEKKELEKFFEHGCHYGRAKRYTHPSIKSFLIKNKRSNLEFFNIEKTITKIKEVAKYLASLLKDNKIILFVGAKPAAEGPIKEIAQEFNMPYINYKWVGGFLTNFSTIKLRIDYLKELMNKESSGEIEDYPPQDKQRIKRELKKMKNLYEGVLNLKDLPDALFIIDLNYNQHQNALKEAIKKNIPVIGLCGSDNDVSKLDYFIPANDKAPSSINFILKYLTQKVKELL